MTASGRMPALPDYTISVLHQPHLFDQRLEVLLADVRPDLVETLLSRDLHVGEPAAARRRSPSGAASVAVHSLHFVIAEFFAAHDDARSGDSVRTAAACVAMLS